MVSNTLKELIVISPFICAVFSGLGTNLYVGREITNTREEVNMSFVTNNCNITYSDEKIIRYKLKPLKRIFPVGLGIFFGGLIGTSSSIFLEEMLGIRGRGPYHHGQSFPSSSYYNTDDWD